MSGRGSLYLAHRVLIGSAIGLSALLLIHGVARFSARHEVGSLVTGVLAAAVGCGLAGYLVRIARR